MEAVCEPVAQKLEELDNLPHYPLHHNTRMILPEAGDDNPQGCAIELLSEGGCRVAVPDISLKNLKPNTPIQLRTTIPPHGLVINGYVAREPEAIATWGVRMAIVFEKMDDADYKHLMEFIRGLSDEFRDIGERRSKLRTQKRRRRRLVMAAAIFVACSAMLAILYVIANASGWFNNFVEENRGMGNPLADSSQTIITNSGEHVQVPADFSSEQIETIKSLSASEVKEVRSQFTFDEIQSTVKSSSSADIRGAWESLPAAQKNLYRNQFTPAERAKIKESLKGVE